MKVFIGLVEIANYYTSLKQGLESLGVEVGFVKQVPHPFYISTQAKSRLEKLLQIIIHKRTKVATKEDLYFVLIRKFLTLLMRFLKAIILFKSIVNYDVFIFGFQSSFFDFKELSLLKFLGKKIIYVFHGADARPPYIDGALMSGEVNDNKISECLELTIQQKKKITQIEKCSDLIIAGFPISHFFTKTIINFTEIGLPYQLTDTLNLEANQNLCQKGGSITILHSPSHPEAKGTIIVENAIKAVKNKGFEINYIRITDMSNSIVLERLKCCDFIIDQVYSDIPMAGFATEAAFYGKPAIVGGYFTEDDIKLTRIPPSLHCHPDMIEKAIEKLILDEDYRLTLGQQAKQFVETQWTPHKVAQKYLRLIKGDIDPNWICNPCDLNYIYGCGISQQKSKLIIRRMIEKAGIESLQLQDKPQLEELFRAFAYSDD